jgi:phytoene dehydrogenase-like protein
MWDAIVIGSGIGGLAAAAALAKRKRRVLVLEQHSVAGGLTQTFRRQDWNFAPGVHYIGGVGSHPGQEGQFGRLLAWLTDGALSFAACANPYDIIHLPGFEFGISHPESAYHEALQARFRHATQWRWIDRSRIRQEQSRPAVRDFVCGDCEEPPPAADLQCPGSRQSQSNRYKGLRPAVLTWKALLF